jgi:hypothetical protein
MRNSFLCKQFSFALILLLVISLGCKRTQIDVTPTTPTPGVMLPVNDLPQVTASVSGIVLDESNTPLSGAFVTSGTATTTTNTNGMFILNNISLSKENGSVTVVKAGYFKGIRSFKTTAGKNHSVRLQMMARVLSGTVNAAVGGTITSNGGANIIFPANAFVTSAGAAYTGTVNLYSRWIDPTAANLPFVIPGDLRGISTNGAENILETYGMVGAELTDASGNVLKIATGKTATVSFPIPTSLTASAPATIVLWHFDDASARWKENGTATKTGSTYTAQVDKFSFWNCDVANANFINLDYTLINATTNSPLVSTSTRIKRANGSYGYAITNNVGFVSGLVPKSEALVLEVVSGCNTVAYSQNIGPFSANTSLGNINVTLPASQYINFTGTVLNCSGLPVSNGYVSLYATGGGGTYEPTSPTGAFSFSILNCTGASVAYNYQGVDNTTAQQSAVFGGNATSGIMNLGNVSACGILANTVYAAGWESNLAGIKVAKIWKNGVATNLTDGTKEAEANSVFVSGSDVYVAGGEKNVSGLWIAKLWKNGIASDLTINGNSGVAYSVYVSGVDVYVAGKQSFYPYVWKNGVGTNYSLNPTNTNPNNGGYASSVFVSGNNVYVATKEFGTGHVWTNSNSFYLTTSGEANSVFVSGTDVYVAGYNYPYVTYWKGSNGGTGSFNSLSLESNPGGATSSIFVKGNDVYVIGTLINSTAVWKNGIRSLLQNGAYYSNGYSVYVLGNDVYVAGKEFLPYSLYSIAKIWKNGLPIDLTDGTTKAVANSIFVK